MHFDLLYLSCSDTQQYIWIKKSEEASKMRKLLSKYMGTVYWNIEYKKNIRGDSFSFPRMANFLAFTLKDKSKRQT